MERRVVNEGERRLTDSSVSAEVEGQSVAAINVKGVSSRRVFGGDVEDERGTALKDESTTRLQRRIYR